MPFCQKAARRSSDDDLFICQTNYHCATQYISHFVREQSTKGAFYGTLRLVFKRRMRAYPIRFYHCLCVDLSIVK